MAPGRFGLQAAINRWVNVNQSNAQIQQQDDVSIRHGERELGDSGSRKSYPRKQQQSGTSASSTLRKAKEPSKGAAVAQDDATTVCSSSTIGNASQQSKQRQRVVVAGPNGGEVPWGSMVAAAGIRGANAPVASSGSFVRGHPEIMEEDDTSRASSKRRKHSAGTSFGGGDAHSVTNSVASAPVPGAIDFGVAANRKSSLQRHPAAAVAPGVFYGVDYGVSPIVPPPGAVGGGSMSAAASVCSQRSGSSAQSAPAAAAVACAAAVGAPPTKLFHPMCPGAPSPSMGSIIISHKRPAPSMLKSQSMPVASHHHLSGVASLPGSIVRGNKNKVRGIKSSSSSVISNGSKPPVILEFKDWSLDKNNSMQMPTPATASTGSGFDTPSPPPPTPQHMSGVCPPLLVSVPSGRQLQIPQKPPHSNTAGAPRAVGPVAPPPPQPAMTPPLPCVPLPPPLSGNPSAGMIHIVHSGPSAAASRLQQQQQYQQPPSHPPMVLPNAALKSEEGIADLQAKMEAALVLTSLPHGAPVQAPLHDVPSPSPHPQAKDLPASYSSDSEERKFEDSTGGGISSDGYDGSGEEDGSKMDICPTTSNAKESAGPRKFLKGGKRGRARAAPDQWGKQAKNLADAALLEYQTLEKQQQATDTKVRSSKSKGSSGFRNRLKRTNSKTRGLSQPEPISPST
mmetsp:Transcript_14251/g.30941  ORF Transcript_14251/g.30941 Transcript_14251/m.30941 type:complete len:679 (+) Transcript_14251:72-2108(+)